MTITICPKCGSMNITTAGVCANCGWSQFAQVTTVSTRITGEIEIMLSGKALLDDYKRLLFENRNLTARIAELEAERRWIPASERLPEKSGWYRVGAINVFYEGYTDEVYFDANKTKSGWQSSVRDEIYCWLDGVPELPQPPEVQE